MTDFPMLEKYVQVSWCPEDVKILYPDWSDEKCQDLLDKISPYLEDRLIELGWDVMETLLGNYDEEEED